MWKDFIKKEKYPSHLKETEGEQLKKVFKEKILEKSHNKFYILEFEGYRYFLLEELLFEENDPFLEVNKIIGRNFLLNREKI